MAAKALESAVHHGDGGTEVVEGGTQLFNAPARWIHKAPSRETLDLDPGANCSPAW